MDSVFGPWSEGPQDSASVYHCPEAPMSCTRHEIQALKGGKEGGGGEGNESSSPALLSATHELQEGFCVREARAGLCRVLSRSF